MTQRSNHLIESVAISAHQATLGKSIREASMQSLFKPFFNGSYAPHGYCLLWQPELIWTHVIADALIASAYFSIPIALITFVRRRRDIAFTSIFWLFALFIMACGATHIMSIWTLWHGNYGAEALLKVITAVASVATAIILWPLIPKALALPSPQKLAALNADLQCQILQRENAEAALLQSQKLEAVGQLTGGIAHDFNNLLQAISGSLELIARNASNPERIARWTDSALKAVDSGIALTSQLLAFSRVQRLTLAPVRVASLIEGMGEMLERTLGPMVQLRICAGDPAFTVIADPTQLELAILNLAINARDAMPDGGELRVTVSERAGNVHADLQEGNYIEIEVADDGIGMTPEVRARAFEPFFTTKGVGEGTGLGLSMVFGVVTQSGGAISIDSHPGSGTSIKLLLLQAATSDVAATHRAISPGNTRIGMSGRSVLVIDDDEQVRRVIVDTFSETGARISSADNGTTGLAMLTDIKPDLVVVDFAMPGMNGAEVARRARLAMPDLPILIISGYADSAMVESLSDTGIDLLRKPFRAAELLGKAVDLVAI